MNRIPKPVAIGLAVVAIALLIFGIHKAISVSSTGLSAPAKPRNQATIMQHLYMRQHGIPMGAPSAPPGTRPSGP